MVRLVLLTPATSTRWPTEIDCRDTPAASVPSSVTRVLPPTVMVAEGRNNICGGGFENICTGSHWMLCTVRVLPLRAATTPMK